jgi:hypothetical protein
VAGVERAQATVEYAALVVVALIAACLLVRFATPAERIALDIAHAVTARPRQSRVHPFRSPARRTHRPASHPCLCPLPKPRAG